MKQPAFTTHLKHRLAKLAKRHTMLLAAVLVAIVGSSYLILVHAAGTASLSLSPSGGSHNNGTNFTVAVYENSGSEPVTGVVANLTYDQSKLQFVSSVPSSAFPLCPTNSGGAGSISIQCAAFVNGAPAPATGSTLVSTLTFKALVGSGTTSVSFASSSNIARSPDGANIWNGSTTGGTYALATPVTPTPTPTPAATPTPTSSNPTPTPALPTTKGITGTSTSSSPATATTGASKSGTSNPATTPAAQAANPAAPIPVSMPTSSSTLSGYPVAFTVTDKDGKPVSGASVSLDGTTIKTDITGLAGFLGVTAGNHEVKIASVKGSSSFKVNVSSATPTTTVQTFKVSIKPKSKLPLILEVTAGVFVLVGAGLLWRMRRVKGGMSTPSASGTLPTDYDSGSITPTPTPSTPASTGTITATPVTPAPAPTFAAPSPVSPASGQANGGPGTVISGDSAGK